MVGLPIQPWLMSSRTALLSIILFSVWKGVGYNMIVYLAGLQAIPESFVEAARIDGRRGIRSDSAVSPCPLLAPTTAFLADLQLDPGVPGVRPGVRLDQRRARGLDQRHRARSVPAGLRAVQSSATRPRRPRSCSSLTLGVTVVQYVYSKRYEVSY